MKISKHILILFFLVAAGAEAIELPDSHNVPGGVTIITLTESDKVRPRAKFRGKQVMVIRDRDRWLAVVGLSVKLAPGEYRLDTTTNGKHHQYPVRVVAKEYPVQHLTIKNRRKVYPNKKDLQRINKERTEIGRAFVVWSFNPSPPLKFDLPARGPFSGQFGLTRYYNDSPRPRRHSALDIAAPTGTPVYAPADATVINTGNYYFTGNTIFLDHGQGLLTEYIHLSKLDVKPGERVSRGQKIGEIGATGRVTGPHLHWAVILNQTMVDPIPFVRKRALEENQAYVERLYKGAGGS